MIIASVMRAGYAAAIAMVSLAGVASAEGVARVPQLTERASAFVVQVPESARQIRPINRGNSNPDQAQMRAQAETTTRKSAPRDFILDFEGQREQTSLPSVREGVRLAIR